jgi:predicted GH43/DUF377 family glycosyl hydrolase
MDHADLMSRLRTPHKRDRLVLEPSYVAGQFDSHLVDCPFVFRHGNGFCMTYVGWDGRGYQTGLASSDDLIAWRKEGLIFGRGPAGSVTEHNAALTCILRDSDLRGPGTLRKVGGRYVGTYHAYPDAGYEAGPAVIGLCLSDDLRKWEVLPPVLRPQDGGQWERGGLYKSWILEHEGTYYLFYNAKDRADWPWREQTGAAASRDLQRWERLTGNPLIRNGPAGSFDELFASDPSVLRDGDEWVLFYFGLAADGHARDGAAVSPDLRTWEKLPEVLVDVGPEGAIDSTHAHKPSIFSWGGRLYHFYCAVSPAPGALGQVQVAERRGIALACSEPCA